MAVEFDRRTAGTPARRKLQSEEASSTSVDQAAMLIRQAIVTARYEPGERITVAGLSERFGFGAMPTREALRKLEGEGLVEIEPNRGATVRRVDRRFIEELYEVQMQLELLAVARCMTRMTLDKLEVLDGLRLAHEAAIESRQVMATVETNRALHIRLFEFSANSEATRLFIRGWELMSALRLRFRYHPTRLRIIVEEHRVLLEALRRLDLDAASAVIRMQYAAGIEDIIQGLDEQTAAEHKTAR